MCTSQTVECVMFLQSLAGVQCLASALSHKISVSMTLGVKTWAQKMRAHPVSRNRCFFCPGTPDDSDRIKSIRKVTSVLSYKHCKYSGPQELTCFFLQRQSAIISSLCFLGHSMYAAMCLSFPVEAAESHRFSCNTLVNSFCMSGYCHQSLFPSRLVLYLLFFLIALLCVTSSVLPINICRDAETNGCVRLAGMCLFVFDTSLHTQSVVAVLNWKWKWHHALHFSFQICVHYVYQNCTERDITEMYTFTQAYKQHPVITESSRRHSYDFIKWTLDPQRRWVDLFPLSSFYFTRELRSLTEIVAVLSPYL